ncbi:MAG: hypothetical protein KF693_07735, partial [Nitrospira sp.]|nr:hypothetical protein [Nitrospira sp.]
MDEEWVANVWKGSRSSFDRADLEDYNAVTFERESKDRAQTANCSLAGSDAEPEKERNLASGDRVRFSGRQALSAIV